MNGPKVIVSGIAYAAKVDSEGQFSVLIGRQRYTADTLAQLRENVAFELAGVRVEVPFTVMWNGMIRTGVAVGTRRIDSSILVKWDDTGEVGTVSWGHRALRLLDVGEQDAYRRLVAERDAAQLALDQFERPRSIDLKDGIRQARADAAASKAHPVHMARYTESGRDTGHAVCGNPDGLIAGQDSGVTCTACLDRQDAQYTEARG